MKNTKKIGNKIRNKMGLIVGIVLCVVIVGAIFAMFAMESSAVTPAYLNVEEGVVEVNRGTGWESASDGMELSLSDAVRTGADGVASVILFESAIVNLESNTEVRISELSKDNSVIQQSSGSTWNKFTKMNGMKGLEVETPTSVATVRGTEFGVDMDNVTVIEGEVATTDKASGKIYAVPAGQKAARLEGKLALAGLSEDEKAKIISKMEKNVNRLEHIAEKQANKKSKIEKVIGKSFKAEKTLAKVEETKKDIADTKAGKLKGKSHGNSKGSSDSNDVVYSDDSNSDQKYYADDAKQNKKPQIMDISVQREEDTEENVYIETSEYKSNGKGPKKD